MFSSAIIDALVRLVVLHVSNASALFSIISRSKNPTLPFPLNMLQRAFCHQQNTGLLSPYHLLPFQFFSVAALVINSLKILKKSGDNLQSSLTLLKMMTSYLTIAEFAS